MSYSYGSYGTPLPGYGTSLVDRINLYLHFRKYFKMVAERWLLLLVLTSIGAGIGIWVAMTTPDKFVAQSVLMNSSKIRSVSMGAEIQEDPQKFADTQIQLMQSSSLMNKVQAKVSEGTAATNKVSRPQFDAYPGKGNTFIMKVTSTNFDYAQKYSEAWALEFIDFKRQQRSSLVGTTQAQTQGDMLKYQAKLDQVRNLLDDFRKRYDIASDRDAGQALQDRLDRAQAEFQETQLQRQLLEKALPEELAADGSGRGVARDKSATPGKQAARNTGANEESNKFDAGNRYTDAKVRIRTVESQIADYSKKLKPAHPFLADLRKQLDAENVELKTALELVEDNRKSRIAAVKVREEAFIKVLEGLRQEVRAGTKIQNDYRLLQEDEAMYKKNLDDLKKALASYDMIAGDDEQFTIVEQGQGSPEPIGPKRPLMIATGVILGLLSGLVAMYLLHRLDDRLEQPEQIEEALEEPIMGQLPEVDKKHYKEGYLLLTRMKTHTMFAESLRGVRSGLLLSPEGSSKRLIAVTSAVPGDGKTTFTTNFAVTLANAGNRTLLIDADLRRGNINGYFEQPLEGGLSEVLEGKLSVKEAVRETGIDNLFFMRAGERPSNPSELLIGPATKEFIRNLRSEFDYVIFDCPPLTAIDDTFSIAAFLDGIFFVVRAGKTSMRFAKLGINTIRQRGAPILGLIVNGVPIDNPYYYYTTYYYASYYHRQDGSAEGDLVNEVDDGEGGSKKLPAPGVESFRKPESHEDHRRSPENPKKSEKR